MDSLVASIIGGATITHCRWRHVLKIAFVMGLFQGGATLAGYLFGLGFEQYIYTVDHWVAFGLLAYLGGRMIYGECCGKDKKKPINLLQNKQLIYLSFATSVDAVAVGISLAILKSPILWQSIIIGSGTFAAVACGVCFGHYCGQKANVKWLGVAGGLILIGIGVKILCEHLAR